MSKMIMALIILTMCTACAVSANNGDAIRLAGLAGRGLILQPTFIVGDDIRAGRLQLVLEDYEVEPMAVYAVYAHRQYLSGKVRTFVDFLGNFFAIINRGSL